MSREPFRNVMQAFQDLRKQMMACDLLPPDQIVFGNRSDALNFLAEVEQITGASVRATPKPTDPCTTYQAGQLMGFEIRYKP